MESILTEAKNLHMNHAEEMSYLYGTSGLRDAINFFRGVRDMLSGSGTDSYSLSTKWDGAPAIFVGTNPENGKFFVATKSLFNKVPKINYNNADIQANHPGELGKKLEVALRHLKKLNIPKDTILQGDMMFDSSDLEYENIDGESHVVFQPNTITYAVKTGTETAKKIESAKMGIVFHTTYKGDTIANLSASFGADTSKLTKTKDVWFDNADFKVTNAVMSKTETDVVTAILSRVGKTFRKLNSRFVNSIDATKKGNTLGALLLIYNNSQIRKGIRTQYSKRIYDGLLEFLEERMEKEMSKVKTEKSKQKRKDEFTNIMNTLKSNKDQMIALFDIQVDLVAVKNILVKKLEQVEQETKTFIRDNAGYKVTTPEGFVAVSAKKGNAVKLVDRLEFSANNFNTELKKWAKK